MNFVNRALNVLTQPKPELAKAAAEPATTATLVATYGATLGALPTTGKLIALIIGAGSALGAIIVKALILCILLWALRDVGLTVLMGVIAAALAPNFGGMKNSTGAMKLAMYAATPIWITSFIGALLSFAVPELAPILVLAGFGYAGYLIYVGCGPLLGVPDTQAPAVAGILTVIWLVLYFLVASIIGRIVFGYGFGLYSLV